MPRPKRGVKQNKKPRISPGLTRPFGSVSFEKKLGAHLHLFSRYFQDRIGEKIDRPLVRAGCKDQIPATTKLETIGRMMAEIVSRQARVFVRLGNIDGPPLALSVELHPAMITIDASVVALGRNRSTYAKTRGDTHGPCQRDKVSVEIGTIARANVARVHRVPFSPAGSVFHVPHLVDHVIIECAGADQVAFIARNRLGGDAFKFGVDRSEVVGPKIF